MGSNTWRGVMAAVLVCSVSALAAAQTTDLANGGAELILNGASGQRAGTYLDHGSVSAGDARKDLIIGAPQDAGTGNVYIFFAGPVPSGTVGLSTASVVISGTVAGDGFGSVVANGSILSEEGSAQKTLVVAAPRALSGRGAVYLFRTGYTEGLHLTTADAVFTITGAAGDALGSALATADLDGDGYRDIIIGAPGNNRVYVIYGGPSLSGSRDLSSTAADIRISGSGIGGVLTAGDIRGTGHYSILLGVPSLNLVYIIHGRTSRSFPANMTVSADEDAYLVGTGTEKAGSTLRIGDFDGDGVGDIVVGAPGGSGASGSIYILWGRSNWTSMSLSSADIKVLGPWQGAHLGRVVTFGDINRDNPNDLAAVVNGASGTADEVLVYYGRRRSDFGATGATGQRVLDLSVSSNVDRRIIADPTAGTLASADIYELTGEGAHDIVVGTPDASVGSDASAGRVFFVTSPKLSLSPKSVMLFGAAGAAATPVSVQVRNASSLGITWAATPGATWVAATPATGSAIDTADGQTSITASATAPGVYSGSVDVSSTSHHLDMTLSIPVTLTAVSVPTLTANSTFPAMAGSAITWTASATAGGPAVEYRFWRNDPSVGWHIVQDYGAGNTYTWTPQTTDAGTHFIQVWVRAVGSSNTYDSYVASNSFTITRPVATLTSFDADKLFPQPTGTAIQWTAAAAPAGLVEYKFWIYRDGQGWSVLQDYSPSATVNWSPTSAGTYAVEVWARAMGSGVSYDDWRSSAMLTISNTAPLQVVRLSSDPASAPYQAGTPITWTAQTTGGSAGPIQYKFWRFDQSTGTWAMARDYSTSSTLTWTPADPADAGTHAIEVWARSGGVTANYEAWRSTDNFTVVHNAVSSVALVGDMASPMPVNSQVTWTATATGGVAPVQYKFWVYRDGTGWSVLRDWSAARTATWTPTATGTYAVQVWARASGSSTNYEAWSGTPLMTVGVSGAASVVEVRSSVPLPATTGTAITWTAVASGGTAGPLEFKFWRFDGKTGTWSLVQDYSTVNTFAWTPSPSETGNYAIEVWVRSQGATANYEGWLSTGSFMIK